MSSFEYIAGLIDKKSLRREPRMKKGFRATPVQIGSDGFSRQNSRGEF